MDEWLKRQLEATLVRYLEGRAGYGAPSFVNAGASAAVFRVEAPVGTRAMKVFAPEFLADEVGLAERRRLELQRSLIGHDCPQLVQTFGVDEFEDTAVVEMEFVEWPQLATRLSEVPDDRVDVLVSQLVAAVKFLESREIVHRDIKPANIHVSDDFSQLVLLDLGVAREFSLTDDQEPLATDHHMRRPFLATAQYSSPEYLFRLDEPNERLWHGLNLYQVGAVLHDLIMREPMFAEDIALGNKWLIARSVLVKVPSVEDGEPSRLHRQKAVAARALAKDLETRLRTVQWDDFTVTEVSDRLAALKDALARRESSVSAGASATTLAFKRREFLRRVSEQIRNHVVAVAAPMFPCKLDRREEVGDDGSSGFCLVFTPQGFEVVFEVSLRWNDGIYEERARVDVAAFLRTTDTSVDREFHEYAEAAILENEEVLVVELSNSVGLVLQNALDQMDVATNPHEMDGFDLVQLGVR